METLPGSSISKSMPQEITFSSYFCVDFRASCLCSLSLAQLCRWRHWGDGMAWDCEEQFLVFCMHFCIPIKRIVYSHSLSFRSELLHCYIAQQHCSLLSCNLNPKPSNHVNLVGHVGDWLLYIISSHLSLANLQHIIPDQVNWESHSTSSFEYSPRWNDYQQCCWFACQFLLQRGLFFSFKMGIRQILAKSVKLALAAAPVAELFVFVCSYSKNSILMMHMRQMLWLEFVFVAGAFFTTLCWELCNHLIQVQWW